MKPPPPANVIRGMRAVCTLLIVLFATLPAFAAAGLERLTVTVDGVTREAFVARPEKAGTKPAPLVFVFHGHGGTARHAARSMPIHAHWPEAIVVYPQGLPTPGQLTDPQGKENGWQSSAGVQGDRDLKFVDALLVALQKSDRFDGDRVYATGHSNGGGFTYLLWAERAEKFAAFAPSAALLSPRKGRLRTPRPVLHVGSPADDLVKFRWQEQMLAGVAKLNGTAPIATDALGYREYPGRDGQDVAVLLHDGGHKYPTDLAPERIARFFQAHPRR